MSETIKITGGISLRGSVTPVPNKNAILPALSASILTDECITYHNVPRSTDVLKMLEMLKLMGAEVIDEDFNSLKICCKNMNSYTVDKQLGNLIRSSVMFAGPLLARFNKAKIPVPGGCVLGKRSISAHIDAFTKADIKVDFEDGYVVFTAPKNVKDSYDIWQFEASVTATENIFMYAAGVNSCITVSDAACEPHITQLLELLSDMGAEIKGIGSNRVGLKGGKLSSAKFSPYPDHIDIAGIIVAAAITKGEIRIKDSNIPNVVDGMIEWFEKFNIGIIRDKNDLVINGGKDLYIDPKTSGMPLASDDMAKFVPRPWPGFPVDALPSIVTLSCKTKGKLMVQNWMYETGLDFIRELNAMGANIFMADPQRVIVYGPVNFKSGKITAPGIIQACKAIFLAALADPVETTINGVEILKRRYPDIISVYKELGAQIEIL